jgi:hypothetical protein
VVASTGFARFEFNLVLNSLRKSEPKHMGKALVIAVVIMLGKSISTGAQDVTPDSKIYCEKVKRCRFSSENWFFCTKFVQLAPWLLVNVATQMCTSKKGCNKLDLTATQYF